MLVAHYGVKVNMNLSKYELKMSPTKVFRVSERILKLFSSICGAV